MFRRRIASKCALHCLFVAIVLGATLVISSCVSGMSRNDLATDYYDLGNAYAGIGQDAKALEYYGKAISLNPGLASANYNLARIYLKQGKAADALKILRGLLAKDPSNSKMLDTEGYCLYVLDRKQEALAAFRQALGIDPGSATILNNLAVVEHSVEDFAAAYDHVLQAQHIVPENTDLLLRVAQFARDAKKYADAIRYFEDYVQKKPDDTAALTSLGDLYTQERYFDRALSAYTLVLSKGANSDVLFKKASIELTAAADPSHGLKDLEDALKAGFQDPKAVAHLLAAEDLQSKSEVLLLFQKYLPNPAPAEAAPK